MVAWVDRATLRAMSDYKHLSSAMIVPPCPGALVLDRVFMATLVALCLGLLGGCDRNIEPYQPGEESSQPELERIFPGSAEGLGAAGFGEAAGGPIARQAFPPSRTEAAPPAASNTAPSGPIEGEIHIAPELAAVRPVGGVLFVIARPRGSTGGPPLAVLRIAEPTFPLAFRIGPENVMIPSMKFTGDISLSARLDADGNAMTRGADDLSSETAESLVPGATGVRLVLSERG
jgi:hypothetical protein